MATTFIFSVLAQPGDPISLEGLTPAQFAALNPADLIGSTPNPPTGTPTSYDVLVRAQTPAAATDIGKNLVVLLGTLITAVSSFYFGSRSATAAAAEMAKQIPSARPQISQVDPARGPESGGTPVTLTGAGFTGAVAVAFGSRTADTITVESDTEISTVSPAGTGTVELPIPAQGENPPGV
ncbi:IPT/TIG domain-containing protein [Winogradskya humida]|uniref:IPT/TIG domain-containing protein n=1 Tax=Winogradskya humida TaxID=113566 RepID=A0ABQ3ZZ05_9ACTN|nr:IPT/TIG domain-containing protein [Actinoplanes humidus]GIE23648.1 hypothetical protein Ahu01nite_067500 [Actinoplanes humidus]